MKYLIPFLLLSATANADSVHQCKFVPIKRPESFREFDATKYLTVWSCQGLDLMISKDPVLYDKAKEELQLIVKTENGKSYIVGVKQ